MRYPTACSGRAAARGARDPGAHPVFDTADVYWHVLLVHGRCRPAHGRSAHLFVRTGWCQIGVKWLRGVLGEPGSLSFYQPMMGVGKGRLELPRLSAHDPKSLVEQFIQSRSGGLSVNTLHYYRRALTRATSIARPGATPPEVNAYLKSIPGNLGNQHAHYRAVRVFFRWLYSPRSGIGGLHPHENPMLYVDPPKVPKRILPSLTSEQVELLIAEAGSLRDKAIIAVLTDSELRVSELCLIRQEDIDWDAHTIKVIGKGNRESHAPFGTLSGRYLHSWLQRSGPKPGEPIWGITARGVQHMLKGLSEKTGLPCNPHTFRRTFACLLRKAGVDSLSIKDLGRWESVEMVEGYTRSFTFEQSMNLYKSPLG